MVLHYSQGESIAVDSHVFIGDVDTVVCREIAEEINTPIAESARNDPKKNDILVEVVDDMRLVSDNIAQAVRRVGINEAVTDPFTRFDPAYLSVQTGIPVGTTHVSEISATSSNASSTPSSPKTSPVSARTS